MGIFSGRVRCSLMAFPVAAALWCTGAYAQILVHFDLPAQPLARSLKAIGTATNMDVGFSASQVAGFMAPSLKADLTVDGALARVLAGTGLRPQHLDDHTIVIATVESSTSDSAEGKPLPTRAFTSTGQPDPSHAMILADNSSTLQLAQTNASDQDNAANSQRKDSRNPEDQLQEVTVTGTHIRGVTPSSPVIQIGRDQIDQSGYVTVSDIMRSLPQNFAGGSSPQTATGSSINPTNNGSFGGGSAPNLRGLGATSTLTLINGHRLAQDTVTGAVDITAIPLDAIERIDVITDGASAAYGSDAVAGVVNIIVAAPRDGAKATLSSGYATDGGGLDKRASVLAGKTWDGGGALLVYEHESQDGVLASQRDFTSTVYSPYSLLPSTNRNSYFLSGKQNISSGLTASLEGFYTSRAAEFFATDGPGVSFAIPSAVQSYGGTVELRAALPRDWVASIDGTFGNQRTDTPVYQLNAIGPSTASSSEDITGSTRSVEISADGALFDAPGGTARLAVGGGHRREGLNSTFALPDTPSEPIGIGSRGISYGFGELAVPVIGPRADGRAGSLDLNVSGRFEHYSDFGQTTVPKFGLRYHLTPTLSLRGDWGRSFHAPTLYQVYAPSPIALDTSSDPNSPSGVSKVLVRSGGNTGLRPERAKTWTLGADYKPDWLPESLLSVTYFNIAYRDRISQLANPLAALSDPIEASFVTRSPSPALQQALIDGAGGGFTNYTGAPYDPSSVVAVIDYRNINIARQDIEGVDLLFDKKRQLSVFGVDEFFNGTYLQLRDQITGAAPEQELTGTVFNPPRVRLRGGATVTFAGWSATATANYTGRESNNLVNGSPDIASWTTIDAQLAYVVPPNGPLSGIRVSLSAINLFDRSPPYLQYNASRIGFNYDVANASPIGRFVTLQVQKNW